MIPKTYDPVIEAPRDPEKEDLFSPWQYFWWNMKDDRFFVRCGEFWKYLGSIKD